MKLHELFREHPEAMIEGFAETEIGGISVHSSDVVPGDLFVALRGANHDGYEFVNDAILRGAAAVCFEKNRPEALDVPRVVMPSVRSQMGHLSSRVYGDPSAFMRVVGITGTNGKTTTSCLVESILNCGKNRTAYIGTLGYRWPGVEAKLPRTTPEASYLQRLLRTMKSAGVTDVVMECSSHGIEMGRLDGIHLDVALLTNVTPEHLDFHKTMTAYAEAKRKLYSRILSSSSKLQKTSIFNIDDEWGRRFSTEFKEAITYSNSNPAAVVHAVETAYSGEGLIAQIKAGDQKFEVRSSLIGAYNLSNILGAVSVAHALRIPAEIIQEGIRSVRGVPGRVQRVPNRSGVHVIVDYAHTEDAFQNLIRAVSPFRSRRIIFVFGCGGERDRSKRSKMARVVAGRADIGIVTTDNPRSEPPEQIVIDILSGLSKSHPVEEAKNLNEASTGMFCVIEDRERAIEKAISISRPGDIVLITGKGPDTYQEVKGVRTPFDDHEVAAKCLRKLEGAN